MKIFSFLREKEELWRITNRDSVSRATLAWARWHAPCAGAWWRTWPGWWGQTCSGSGASRGSWAVAPVSSGTQRSSRRRADLLLVFNLKQLIFTGVWLAKCRRWSLCQKPGAPEGDPGDVSDPGGVCRGGKRVHRSGHGHRWPVRGWHVREN